MDSNAVLLALQNKVSSEGLSILQDKLKSANESQLEKIVIIPFKSPVVGLILGFSLGVLGADRFYKGDDLIGSLKAFILLILLFILFSAISSISFGTSKAFSVSYGITYATSLGWWFIDLFLVWKGIKKDNLKKVLDQLQ